MTSRLPERIFTGVAWADVVVDLRSDRRAALPSTFSGRRKSWAQGTAFAATRRAYRRETTMLIVRWTDPTGFRGAVIGNADGGARVTFGATVPYLDHLVTEGGMSLSVTERRVEQRREDLFAHAAPAVREVLASGAIAETVLGLRNGLESIRYRLAWASVGVADLDAIPEDLRGLDEHSNPWAGPLAVARFREAGFTDLHDIAEWATALFGSAKNAAGPSRAQQVASAGEFHAAGFGASEALSWLKSAQYDRKPERLLPAEVCAEFKTAGGTPETLRWVISGMGSLDVGKGEVAKHVRGWLAVTNPDRAAWYVAAHVSRTEARRMERSSGRPDAAALQVLAAFAGVREGMPALPASV